jgi:hypothetical protein
VERKGRSQPVENISQNMDDPSVDLHTWTIRAESGSSSVLLLAFSFLARAAFLIVPREVMTNWVSGGQTSEPGSALAFDHFAESTDLVALFANDRLTEAWALTFVQAPTHAPQEEADLGPEPATSRFWIWSGEQLSDLTRLEEAQWYGRFAAR